MSAAVQIQRPPEPRAAAFSDPGPAMRALRISDLVIVDWDDTILPSSWLQRSGVTLGSDAQTVRAALREVDREASSFLRRLASVGTVVIVTNAERDWVLSSSEHFLPSVAPLVRDLTIVSARELYGPMFPTEPMAWKVRAFQSLFENSSSVGEIVNVYSIGDSHGERLALFQLRSERLGFRKSVKMLELPDATTLQFELNYLSSQLGAIQSQQGDVDVEVR